MKRLILKIIGLAIAGLILTSCSLDPSHSIRIKNSCSEGLRNVFINPVGYGTVNAGTTTDYKPVDEGSFSLSGSTITSNKSFTGSGTVTGKGVHKWTLEITSAGEATISEDK